VGGGEVLILVIGIFRVLYAADGDDGGFY